MRDVPGTVSQILWHFTGGPRWNETENRQNVAAKPSANAYKALLGILENRELRLGGYKEVVRVRLDRLKVWDAKKKQHRVEHNVMRTLKSAPVCCLADIPIMHLSYHANRYGKFAIGFHRESVVRAGFNPVFYTLHHSDVVRRIRQGFARIRSVEVDSIEDLVSDIESEAENVKCDIDAYVSAIRVLTDDVGSRVDTAKQSISHFLAFIKTFDEDEFQTVYCEREWRSVAPFSFDYDDLAMIVLPRVVGDNEYFQPFVRAKLKQLGLPAGIPVVPWETLLES